MIGTECLKIKRLLLFSLLFFAMIVQIPAQPQILATVETVAEWYDKVSLNPDDQNIGSVLFSIKPQLIWENERSMLLLNLQLYGDLGGMAEQWDGEAEEMTAMPDGLFSNDDVLGIALKPDTFYRTFIGDSSLYFKVGKYTTEIPYQFGGELVTGQFEGGFQNDLLRMYFSSIFFEWYKVNPFADENQKTVQLFSLDWRTSDFSLKFRYPVYLTGGGEDIGQYPSLLIQAKKDRLLNSLFGGMAYRRNEEGAGGKVFAFRDEASFLYGEHFTTTGLYSLLTAGESSVDTYSFTSIDAQTPLFGYGNHFDYIYEEVGNIYGVHTIGLKQEYTNHPLVIWIEGGSYISYLPGTGDNNYIGTAVRGDLKWFDPWGPGSLFELLASVFIPGGFTEVDGVQNRNTGVQLLVKLQQSY